MRWMLIFFAMTIAGCGKQEPDRSMKSVVQKIRELAVTQSEAALYEQVGMTPDSSEEERVSRDGERSYRWVRFPASDGFVWAEKTYSKEVGHRFIPSTIQFSQSGKRE